MASSKQAARGIDRKAAVQGGQTPLDGSPSLSGLEKSEVFCPDDLEDTESIMDLCKLNISRIELSHGISFERGSLCGTESGKGGPVPQGHGIRRMAHARNADGRFLASEDNSGSAVGVWRAVEQSQWGGDEPTFLIHLAGYRPLGPSIRI